MKEDPDGDYAPRSPDLSAYDSDTVTAFDQKYRGSISHPTPHITTISQPPPPLTPQHHAYIPPDNTPGTVPMPSRFGKMKLEAEDQVWSPQKPHIAMDPLQSSNGQSIKSHNDLAPGVAEGIEVRTKFPAARIKRIMQADEDVGKVAQVTPHVVGQSPCPSLSSPRHAHAPRLRLQQKHSSSL